jgi:hypothetical protein
VMDDKLVLRAKAVKAAVESGKESFIAVKSEYEVNQKLLNEARAEMEEKFGVATYEELQTTLQTLAQDIAEKLTAIEELLAAAEIPLVEVEE